MMLTPEQLAELRRLANKAVPSAEWFLSQHLNEVPFIDGAAAKFIVAANPEAILHMLDMLDAQQARIDALMLEFCPEEMTEEQRAEWARNQVPASQWPEDTSDYGSRIAIVGQNGNDGLAYQEEQP